MTTKQTDAVAMTEEQLDTVVGGGVFAKLDGVQGRVQQRRSNRTRYTAVDADALRPALGATDPDHKDW